MSTQQPHHQHAPHDHDHEHSHDHGHHHDHHDHEQDKKTGHDHHGHSHHGHGHGHSHAPKDFGKAFLIGIILNVGFVAIEAFYGVLINSLALLADASHNLSDVLGLLLAWGASVLVKKAPSARYTYGLRSTSILAALTNAVLLLVVTGGIAWEAIQRFSEPGNTHGTTMMTVAAIGIVINLATAFLFMSGQKEDLNVRAAFTHMLGDAAIAFGVVVAGVIILYTGWQWVDPAVSLLIAVLVVWGTWGLLHDSVNLTLHAVPDGINPIDVRNYLASIDGVESVHDLHIWGMSTTETALTAHLTMPKGLPGDQFYSDLTQHLKEKFGIDHPTVQVELKDTGLPCKLEPEGVV